MEKADMEKMDRLRAVFWRLEEDLQDEATRHRTNILALYNTAVANMEGVVE